MATFCHVCQTGQTVELLGFRDLYRVSSDCLPLPNGGKLLACASCCTVVTQIDVGWRDMVAKIYKDYSVYAQSNGADELSFSSEGLTTPRSKKILEFVAPHVRSIQGTWLDFGCGNGSFLRNISESFTSVTLIGMEFDDHYRSEVTQIPRVLDLVTDWDHSSLENLRVVSMIHVLEHIEDPLVLLNKIRCRLQNDGILIIEVPHIWSNPYVLTVGDHATHFDLPSLLRLVRTAGFEILRKSVDLIPGELTVVAQKPALVEVTDSETEIPFEPEQNIGEKYAANAQGLIDGLVRVSDWLHEKREQSDSMGIFGTSIGGTWAGTTIKQSHDFWVDENSTRWGQPWLGKQIIPVTEVPNDSFIAFVLGPQKARDVVHRLECSTNAFLIGMPPM